MNHQFQYSPYWEANSNGKFIYDRNEPLKARAFSGGVGLLHIVVSPFAALGFGLSLAFDVIKVVACTAVLFITFGQIPVLVSSIGKNSIAFWNDFVGLSTYPIATLAFFCGIIHPRIASYTIKLLDHCTIKA
jgi:hypothetical protein